MKKKISLEDITNKFIRPLNSKTEKKLVSFFLDNNISYEDYDSLKGNLFEVPNNVYQYLLQEGFKIELVEVNNLGLLSLEEQRKIRQYRSSKLSKKNTDKAIKNFQRQYGLR